MTTKYTNYHKIYKMTTKCTNYHKIYQMTTKYTKWQQNMPNDQKIPKDHKIYQMTKKYTKGPQNIPKDHKICQMAIKYNHLALLILRPSKILPKLGSCYANITSGNPGPEADNPHREQKIYMKTPSRSVHVSTKCKWRSMTGLRRNFFIPNCPLHT
jgi:hypothetical protein